jgi:hypothetical protein
MIAIDDEARPLVAERLAESRANQTFPGNENRQTLYPERRDDRRRQDMIARKGGTL